MTTQIIALLIAIVIAIFEAVVIWLIVTATDDMPRIRNADGFGAKDAEPWGG